MPSLQVTAGAAPPAAAAAVTQQPEFLLPYLLYLLGHHPDMPQARRGVGGGVLRGCGRAYLLYLLGRTTLTFPRQGEGGVIRGGPGDGEVCGGWGRSGGTLGVPVRGPPQTSPMPEARGMSVAACLCTHPWNEDKLG